MADIVAEITAASAEQASGIGQVNSAVAQMDEMTQQNSALVEESASASESLGQQANELDDLISFFQVSGSGVSTTSHMAGKGGGPVLAGLPKPQAKTKGKQKAEGKPRLSGVRALPNKEKMVASQGGEWSEF